MEHADAKHSYCYHPDVDNFPKAAHPKVFYLSSISLQKKTKKLLICLFFCKYLQVKFVCIMLFQL